ncbi:hypothetical protein ABFU82_06200 [Nocardioides sp. WV_118_6]|uniref:hypothetical protein n=1 Tax=Nocardioides simplex TaxID=2045 RepID=UPI00214FCD48|nr:hypothetical protein [Pimelobacter simplex]UUW88001.1 hypothetical protein M0M43_19945 [Pimelobacter simplex]UUW97505.1 hypothetical protein M0M48_08590 [Pimelobacter simplex]
MIRRTLHLGAALRLVRSGGVAVAALAVALAATLTACSSNRPDGTRVEGPVSFLADPEARQAAFTQVNGGKTVVYGALAAENKGHEPATLISATLTGTQGRYTDEGVRIVEVRARDVTGGREMVGADHWPYEDYADDSVPLAGYRLDPGDSVELLFVVEVLETGYWGWPQTQLDYEADGDEHTIRVSTGYFVCPRAADDCDPLP